MKRIIGLFIITCFLAMPASSQSAEELFRKAVRLERTTGDYAAAVEAFRSVFEHPSAGRQLEAQSLLQIGLAYENLGRTEALHAFEQLLKEYADIEEVAEMAREGMSRTSFTQQAPNADNSGKTSVQIEGVFYDYGTALSYTGKYMVGTSEKTGHPAYIEMASQQHYEAVTSDVESGWGTEYVRFSPDESRIAYGWYPEGSNISEVRIVDIKEGKSRLLFDPTPFLETHSGGKLSRSEAEVHDWTSDGHSVLVFIWYIIFDQPEAKQMLALIPIDGGEPSILFDGEPMMEFGWKSACLTKNDRYVMADFLTRAEEPDKMQYIMRIDTQTGESARWRYSDSRPYILHGCTNDREKVLYSSSLLESTWLYAGNVGDIGEGLEDEQLISLPEQNGGVPGSHDGDIVSVDGGYKNRFSLLETDPASGTVKRTAKELKSGFVWTGDWTADSKRFVYGDLTPALVIYEPETNSKRTIEIDQPMKAPKWLYGGKQIMAYSQNQADSKAAAFILDAESGALIRTFDKETASKIAGLTTEPDQYIESDLENGCFNVADFGSDETKEFFCPSETGLLMMGLLNSPDFTRYRVFTLSPDSLWTIGVVNADGTGYRALLSGHLAAEPIGYIYWGQENQILFVRFGAGGKSIHGIDTTSGDVKRLYASLNSFVQIRDYRLSPDGKYMTLFSMAQGEYQVTVYHDVLKSKD